MRCYSPWAAKCMETFRLTSLSEFDSPPWCHVGKDINLSRRGRTNEAHNQAWSIAEKES